MNNFVEKCSKKWPKGAYIDPPTSDGFGCL